MKDIEDEFLALVRQLASGRLKSLEAITKTP